MARSFKQRGTVVVPLAESPIPMVEVESIDNPAIFSETVAGEGNITGLTVYGKSMQDGVPSPENPAPIVSAGDGGSIVLTVSDGADQSQSLTLSTPNGLPGIPVDSGGNYTDASGQRRWVDIIDYNNEKKYQYINETVVDGTNIKFTAASGGQYWNLPENSAPSSVQISVTQISKYFPRGVFNVNEKYDFIFTTPNQMAPYFETIEELNAFCVQKNTAGDPLTIMYVMDTPIETPLSEEELTAYRALQTYDGTTVISVNSDPIAPGVKTTVKVIDPNSGNPQIMQLWLDEEGHPVNINGRGARVGGTPTQQYILQPCSF